MKIIIIINYFLVLFIFYLFCKVFYFFIIFNGDIIVYFLIKIFYYLLCYFVINILQSVIVISKIIPIECLYQTILSVYY